MNLESLHDIIDSFVSENFSTDYENGRIEFVGDYSSNDFNSYGKYLVVHRLMDFIKEKYEYDKQ